jgi:quinohemoprotein ethanol dehydrogenase
VEDPAALARGKQLFADRCMVCHGDGAVGGGVIPDLRYLNAARHATWMGTVLGGLHTERGMVSFAGVLSPDDALAIQAFVIERAHQLKERQRSP